jgi:hypothetical protein
MHIKENMASNEGPQAGLRDAEGLCKKQKVCAAKTAQCLDQLIQSITDAESRIRTAGEESSVFRQLCMALQSPDIAKDMTNSTKELHSAVSKLGKVYTPY